MKQEELKKQAESLALKGSWVRKGLQDFLVDWAIATEETLHDSNLQRQIFSHEHKPAYDGDRYVYLFLERNVSDIYSIDAESYTHRHWPAAQRVDIDTADMRVLKSLISELSGLMERYAGRLKKADKEYQGILDILGVKGVKK